MKISLYLGICAAAFMAATAQAADRSWIDYSTLLDITHLDRLYAAPATQRDKLRLLGHMKPHNKQILASEVVLTVVHGAEKKRIQVNPDGSFDPLFNPAWSKDNPQVLTNMPAGEKAGFSFMIVPLLPAGLQFDYATLMASVGQSNALIKSQAGLMRFLFPRFSGLALHFGKPASVQITSKDGVKTYNADASGALLLPLDEAMLKANAQVALSERPQTVDFITN